MTISPRERVLMSLNHEQPDRVPIILGTSNTTSMKIRPYQELKRLLNMPSEDRYIYDWPELGTVQLEESLLQRLHSDARGVLDRFPAHVYQRNQNRPPHSPFIDDWGSGQTEVTPGQWYPSIHPMKDVTTLEGIEAYPWPNMSDPTRWSHAAEQARRLREENTYAVIGTPWLLFPFERAHAMQGLDVFLRNMGRYPDFAEALLRKIATLCKESMGNFLAAVGDQIDIIKIGDDLGTQSSLMISPKMYRKMLKPIHADFIEYIKQRTKAKVFFHTDGDVFDLIPDLIEIGVDILNPIQTSAGRMADLPALKRNYGEKLTFCGAIDTQHILPHGTPSQVQAETRRVVDILAPGGGFMLAPVHTLMNDVPAENILAMVDAAVV